MEPDLFQRSAVFCLNTTGLLALYPIHPDPTYNYANTKLAMF